MEFLIVLMAIGYIALLIWQIGARHDFADFITKKKALDDDISRVTGNSIPSLEGRIPPELTCPPKTGPGDKSEKEEK